jgi:hypothetical protein
VLITAPLVAYVEVFRHTPLLVQIVWFYYAWPFILGIDIPAHVAATLVLPLYTGAFYADHPERGQLHRARGVGRGTCDRNAARKSCAMYSFCRRSRG